MEGFSSSDGHSRRSGATVESTRADNPHPPFGEASEIAAPDAPAAMIRTPTMSAATAPPKGRVRHSSARGFVDAGSAVVATTSARYYLPLMIARREAMFV